MTEEKEEKNPDGEKAEEKEKVTEEGVTEGNKELKHDDEKAEEKVTEEGVTEGNEELNPDDEKAEEKGNVTEEGVTEGNKELKHDGEKVDEKVTEEDVTQGNGHEQEEAQKMDVTEGVIASEVKGTEQKMDVNKECAGVIASEERKTDDNECETATGVIMTIDRDIESIDLKKPVGGCARYRPATIYPDYYSGVNSADEQGQGGSVRYSQEDTGKGETIESLGKQLVAGLDKELVTTVTTIIQDSIDNFSHSSAGSDVEFE